MSGGFNFGYESLLTASRIDCDEAPSRRQSPCASPAGSTPYRCPPKMRMHALRFSLVFAVRRGARFMHTLRLRDSSVPAIAAVTSATAVPVRRVIPEDRFHGLPGNASSHARRDSLPEPCVPPCLPKRSEERRV